MHYYAELEQYNKGMIKQKYGGSGTLGSKKLCVQEEVAIPVVG